MTIRVFVVDDQELVRAGCVMVIQAQEDMVVVGEAADGAQALERLARTSADIVLMDVRMPRVDGVTATRRLLARTAAMPKVATPKVATPKVAVPKVAVPKVATPKVAVPKVIVLTTFDLDEYAFAALRAGASGFLVKDAPADEMLAAIRTVHRGDAVIAPATTRRLLDHVGPYLPVHAGGTDPLAPLTDRERQVLLEVARGASNAEIAARLFLAQSTVKIHVGRILAKLGLRDRVQVVIWAYERRLIRPGDRPDSENQ